MKKLFLFFGLLLLIPVINATSELAPDEVRVNDTVYLIFEWTAPENVENFSIAIDSDEKIIFDSYEYNLSSIEKGENVLKMFKGVGTEVGNYKIKVLKRYFQNGTLIGSVEFFKLSVVPDAGVRIVEKIVIQNATSEEIPVTIEPFKTENETFVEKMSNKTSDESEIMETQENATEKIESPVQTPIIGSYGMYYILGGLILGILLGAVVAYAKD